MREKISLFSYFVLSVVSYFLFVQNWLLEAALIKVISLFIIGFAFYFRKNKVFSLFHLSLLTSIIGEIVLIYGAENYQTTLTIAVSIYYWVTFFLVKNNTRSLKLKKKYFIFSILGSVFLAYAVASILFIVFYKGTIVFTLPILASISFFIVTIYMGLVFMDAQNVRNLWLLLNLISFTIMFIMVPIEALMISSIYLQAIINVVTVASHFFIYQFLITPEYKLELKEETFYL